MTKEEILAKQRQLDILFMAWMEEKKKHEILTFQRKNGDIIQHYPNGEVKVIQYATK